MAIYPWKLVTSLVSKSYLHLEAVELALGDCICFGDDGDDVDLAVQLLHGDQVQGFEWVTGRSDEVEARVDACVVVHVERSLDLQLLLEEVLELLIDVLHNGLVAGRWGLGRERKFNNVRIQSTLPKSNSLGLKKWLRLRENLTYVGFKTIENKERGLQYTFDLGDFSTYMQIRLRQSWLYMYKP